MGNAQGGLDVNVLRKALDSLHIRDIYLREATVRLAEDFLPKLHGGVQLDVQLRWGPKEANEAIWTNNETKESERVFLVLIDTAVRFVTKEEGKKAADEIKPKAEATAIFLAEYKVNTADPIPPEAFEQFAQHNVIYHVWPYWREWLQNVCARTQLPSFTLPMYVIRAKEPEAAVGSKRP